MVDNETQAWIKSDEGLKLHTYIDTNGHCSIGWGRNLENGISLDEAELMFKNDLERSVKELEKYNWYNEQPINVKNALINMNFNLGITKLLEFKEMIECLRLKKYHAANINALNSSWAEQVGQRAKDIAVMISQG